MNDAIHLKDMPQNDEAITNLIIIEDRQNNQERNDCFNLPLVI